MGIAGLINTTYLTGYCYMISIFYNDDNGNHYDSGNDDNVTNVDNNDSNVNYYNSGNDYGNDNVDNDLHDRYDDSNFQNDNNDKNDEHNNDQY